MILSSHWRIALHRRIALGALSKSVIIVEPVVVIPDILSKKASVKFKFNFEKINGNDPKIAIDSHDRAVKIKAWGRSIFLSWSKLDKKNKTPNTIVIMDADTNPESNSLKINWIITGINKIPLKLSKLLGIKNSFIIVHFTWTLFYGKNFNILTINKTVKISAKTWNHL